MKAQTNIIPIALTIIISISTVLIYIDYRLKVNVEERFDAMETTAIEIVKRHLVNLVEITYSTLEFNYKLRSTTTDGKNIEYLKKINIPRLKNIIDIAEIILTLDMEQFKDKELTKSEIQTYTSVIIKRITKQVRYGDKKAGYVWFIDNAHLTPEVIIHPLEFPFDELGEKELKDSCIADKSLLTEFTKVVRKNDDGFVERDCKSIEQELIREFSYVKLLRQWNLIIGVSINLGNVVKTDTSTNIDVGHTNVKLTEAIIRSMRYDDGSGFFWLTNTDEDLPELLVYPIEPLAEKIELIGKNSKYASLVQSFIDVINKSESKHNNFIDHYWDKPTDQGTIKNVLKYSHVMLQEEADAIVGTGIYADDGLKEIAVRKKDVLKKIGFLRIEITILAIFLIVSIVFLNYMLNHFYFSRAKPKLSKGYDIHINVND